MAFVATAVVFLRTVTGKQGPVNDKQMKVFVDLKYCAICRQEFKS